MSAGAEVQRAIDFLSAPELWGYPAATPPHHPDYEALAERARECGLEISPESLRQAFRLMMRARLFASR